MYGDTPNPALSHATQADTSKGTAPYRELPQIRQQNASDHHAIPRTKVSAGPRSRFLDAEPAFWRNLLTPFAREVGGRNLAEARNTSEQGMGGDFERRPAATS